VGMQPLTRMGYMDYGVLSHKITKERPEEIGNMDLSGLSKLFTK
jgi:hypothetical protein